MTTLSYSDMTKLYQAKAKRYTVAQAKAAVLDIDETLSMFTEKSPYVTQLFCERDAMIERYLKAKQP